MTIVKICGLATVDHARAAQQAGADLIGLVFAPSRRQISVEHAGTIVATLRVDTTRAPVGVVGLFVNEQPQVINTVVEQCGLDYVQVSGDETPEQVRGVTRPIIKSVRLNGSAVEHAWLELAQASDTPAAGFAFAPWPFIVDAHVAGAYGGTGTLANWERATHLAQQCPILLAGGLTPDNVGTALTQVGPAGVDVSSGVEANGTKDVALIEAFIRNARSYEQQQQANWSCRKV